MEERILAFWLFLGPFSCTFFGGFTPEQLALSNFNSACRFHLQVMFVKQLSVKFIGRFLVITIYIDRRRWNVLHDLRHFWFVECVWEQNTETVRITGFLAFIRESCRVKSLPSKKFLVAFGQSKLFWVLCSYFIHFKHVSVPVSVLIWFPGICSTLCILCDWQWNKVFVSFTEFLNAKANWYQVNSTGKGTPVKRRGWFIVNTYLKPHANVILFCNIVLGKKACVLKSTIQCSFIVELCKFFLSFRHVE